VTRPGTLVTLRETPSTVSLPTDTGTAFIAGLTDRGPLLAKNILSLQDFINSFGTRQTYSPFYDAVEAFFREGGNSAYISRVVGPGATSGTHNLVDAVAGISLVATANGPGAWSANYKVAVVAGSGAGLFKIQVTDTNNVVLEDSGDLIDVGAAVQWSAYSQYIRLSLGASANDPAIAAPAALSAGTDDRANITDTQWQNAYDKFTPDLGPGQVLAPGRTSSAGKQQLINHAEANGRVALLDFSDTFAVATLQTEAAAVTDSRFAAGFAPWVTIPGIATGLVRVIPPSAVVAGVIARNDPSLGPNRPAAGDAGALRYAVQLSQPNWGDPDRQTLNDAGVNVIRSMFNGFRIYGWRSLTSFSSDSNWIDFGNARLQMAITAELKNIAESFMFEEIDGQNGTTIGSFHTAIAGVMLDHYARREFFGDTANDAFSVDTGPGVNTVTTIANQELHAVVAYKAAPMAEQVVIEVVKAQIAQVF
jgi:phage tail sheath protein FI